MRRSIVGLVVGVGLAAGSGLVVVSSWDAQPIQSVTFPTVETPDTGSAAVRGSGSTATPPSAAPTHPVDSVPPSAVDSTTATQTQTSVAGTSRHRPPAPVTPPSVPATVDSAPAGVVDSCQPGEEFQGEFGCVAVQLPEESIGGARCPNPSHVVLWDGTCGIPDPASGDEKDPVPPANEYWEYPITCPDGTVGYISYDMVFCPFWPEDLTPEEVVPYE